MTPKETASSFALPELSVWLNPLTESYNTFLYTNNHVITYHAELSKLNDTTLHLNGIEQRYFWQQKQAKQKVAVSKKSKLLMNTTK